MLKTSPILLLIAVAALLAGCSGSPSVGPDYVRPQDPEFASWQVDSPVFQAVPAGQTPEALSAWWAQLQDPDLDWLVQAALEGDLSIAGAQARLLQARASRNVAVSAYYPTLGASVAATPTNYGASSMARPDQTQFDAGFDASWEIDLFGKTRRSVEAATAEEQSAKASLENVQVTVIAEVAQNYVDVRNAQQRLLIAQLNLQAQAQTLEIAQWRNQAGLARQTDVDQARASLAQTRASIPDLQISLARAKNRLAVLIGKTPGAVHGRLSEARPLPTLPKTVATAVPAQVLTQRPDIQVAERNLAAQTARVGQQMAQRYPSLNLGGSFSWAAYSLTGLGTMDAFVSRIVGSLAATLFDGGRLRSLVDVQSQAQQEALANYESVVLRALEEVENALVAHAMSRQRSLSWMEAAQASANAASQSRQLYQAGLVDFEQVLITDRAQFNGQESLAQARASELTTLIQLYKALGGGWQQVSEQTEQSLADTMAADRARSGSTPSGSSVRTFHAGTKPI